MILVRQPSSRRQMHKTYSFDNILGQNRIKEANRLYVYGCNYEFAWSIAINYMYNINFFFKRIGDFF
jgi:hypothetical protein